MRRTLVWSFRDLVVSGPAKERRVTPINENTEEFTVRAGYHDDHPRAFSIRFEDRPVHCGQLCVSLSDYRPLTVVFEGPNIPCVKANAGIDGSTIFQSWPGSDFL